MRSTVWAALLVCSVEKTRCPVSAAVIAVDMVSRSRISPTMMTSGSWRMQLRSASWKVGVSVPTSRCEMVALSSWNRNSIGSSIVTTWQGRALAMRLIIAARVVDFPDPVGPVISTMPLGYSVSLPMTSGRFRSSTPAISKGTRRKTAAMVPRWRKMLQRNRATPGTPYPMSTAWVFSNRCRWAGLRSSPSIRSTSSGCRGLALMGMRRP